MNKKAAKHVCRESPSIAEWLLLASLIFISMAIFAAILGQFILSAKPAPVILNNYTTNYYTTNYYTTNYCTTNYCVTNYYYCITGTPLPVTDLVFPQHQEIPTNYFNDNGGTSIYATNIHGSVIRTNGEDSGWTNITIPGNYTNTVLTNLTTNKPAPPTRHYQDSGVFYGSTDDKTPERIYAD